MSPEENPDAGAAEDETVSVVPLPDYRGVSQLIAILPTLVRRVWTVPLDRSLVVVRLPEPIATLLALRCRLTRRPYVAQVVADAGMFARNYFRPRVVGRLAEIMSRRLVRWLVRGADGAIYVTAGALQSAYPPAPGVPTLTLSTPLIRAADITNPRSAPTARRLIAVGSQQSHVKGHDTAIEALRLLRGRDIRYELVLVGSGRLQHELQTLAQRLGVADAVSFLGQLGTPAQVRRQLDAADLFVMPSRTEGLPRALVEAMAAGLPAVASDVGGIPEVIAPKCLVPAEDATALACAVDDIFVTPGLWAQLSTDNVQRARILLSNGNEDRLEEYLRAMANRRASSGGCQH